MLIVAGEALVDLLTGPDGTTTTHLGGSPFNLALALGRLGRKLAYRSPLSQDEYGERFAQALQEAGVSLSGGRSALPSSVARVKLDATGQASYRFEREGVADRSLDPLGILQDWPASAGFFHVGSLALIPPDGLAWCELLRALNLRGVSTSVDINLRPRVANDSHAYLATVREAAALAQWLKLSDEDLLALGLREDPIAAARRFLGPVTEVVLLTLGAAGAWCLTEREELFEPAPQLDVLDSVGAGDCFYAGFLASLDAAAALHGPRQEVQLRAALQLGVRAATFNLQRHGCQAPWLHELTGV